MINTEVEAIMVARYGFVPQPTAGERRMYELIIDSGMFLRTQERVDALRLAEAAVRNGDPLTSEIALQRWNAVNPNNEYSSAELLVGVETDEYSNTY